MEQLWVNEDYSKKLKKELANHDQSMLTELEKYRDFLSYTFSVRLAFEGYRVTTKYKTNLGDFEFIQYIDKVEWNKTIDNKKVIDISNLDDPKDILIKPIICKSSCSSFLKRYNPLLLQEVVKSYKKMKKDKECLDLLHVVFNDAIYDRIPYEVINNTSKISYSHNDIWQRDIYSKLCNMLNTLE